MDANLQKEAGTRSAKLQDDADKAVKTLKRDMADAGTAVLAGRPPTAPALPAPLGPPLGPGAV